MLTEIMSITNKNNFVNFSGLPQIVKKQQKPVALELFAGGGGMALGFEQVGFQHILLNEFDKYCCQTLRLNRPMWPVAQSDVTSLDFAPYRGQVDIVVGGFPCQPFSVAGKRQGFSDERGALFFEYARAVHEIQPKLFVAENVRGLLFHDQRKTLDVVLKTLAEIGYNVLAPKLINAMYYHVPQRCERVFIVGIRKDLNLHFEFPLHSGSTYTVRDALKAGDLFNMDVSHSVGAYYSDRKYKILKQIPEGGNWRNLPLEIQKSYLGKAYGKGSSTQVARRLSWDQPCYTLLTKPDAHFTERCHPEETRPLTVREYARIQTFPDNWHFVGPKSAQYAQIGNAVPINLAKAIAASAKQALLSNSKCNAREGDEYA